MRGLAGVPLFISKAESPIGLGRPPLHSLVAAAWHRTTLTQGRIRNDKNNRKIRNRQKQEKTHGVQGPHFRFLVESHGVQGPHFRFFG